LSLDRIGFLLVVSPTGAGMGIANANYSARGGLVVATDPLNLIDPT